MVLFAGGGQVALVGVVVAMAGIALEDEGEGAAMALIGLAIGGLAAIPLSGFLSGLLFGVEPVDPLTIVTAAALLLGVALVAAWIPARAATAVDTMTALRQN